MSLARSRRGRSTAVIENVRLFGDLAADPRFVEPPTAFRSLLDDGAHATISRYGVL